MQYYCPVCFAEILFADRDKSCFVCEQVQARSLPSPGEGCGRLPQMHGMRNRHHPHRAAYVSTVKLLSWKTGAGALPSAPAAGNVKSAVTTKTRWVFWSIAMTRAMGRVLIVTTGM